VVIGETYYFAVLGLPGTNFTGTIQYGSIGMREKRAQEGKGRREKERE
jgi:hypothetical protein